MMLHNVKHFGRFDEKPVSTEGCYYSFPQVENLMLLEPPDTILDNDEFLP